MTYWLRAADDVVNHRRAGDLQPSISTACVFPSCTYLDTSISKPFFFSVSSAWKLKSKQSFLRVKTYSNSTLYKWHFFQIWTFKKISVKSFRQGQPRSEQQANVSGTCRWHLGWAGRRQATRPRTHVFVNIQSFSLVVFSHGPTRTWSGNVTGESAGGGLCHT